MKRLVVKIGGHVLERLDAHAPVLRDLAEDITELSAAGVDVALVHGGGPQIVDLLKRLGLESRVHEGLRITDANSMVYVAMALAHVNLLVTTALNQAGLVAVGLSGADGSLFRASSLGDPWGCVGGVPRVRTEIVATQWAGGVTPVLSSVATDDCGALLNLNADTAAGALAGALGADALVLLSDVDQVRADLDDPTSGLEHVTMSQIRELLESGAARMGMRPKLAAVLNALDAGAQRVIMANGAHAHALREALANAIPTTEVVR